MATGSTDARATFGLLFRVGEFRALWSSQVLSVLGDQLARVALTLLVYDRTRSALLAAVTFAASVVPTFVGGVTLAGLADRLPRRRVMIGCDLARAALVLAMAVPRVPIAVLVALLFAVTMIGAPFTSARAAIYPDVLKGDLYVLGNATALTTYQFAQVLGFAVGGAVVVGFGTTASLIADAATYLASAVIIRIWVKHRPAACTGQTRRSAASGLADAVRLVFARPALRTPMLLGWLAAFYNAPEGIAAPLADSLGAGSIAVGILLAATALGASIGAVLFSRLVEPGQREQWMRPLAVAASAILLLFAVRPGLPVALLILFASGLFDSYQIAASAAFVRATPPDQRSQAFGLAQAGMSLGQGIAMILAGVAVRAASPEAVIAVAGGLGALTAAAIGARRENREKRTQRAAAR